MSTELVRRAASRQSSVLSSATTAVVPHFETTGPHCNPLPPTANFTVKPLQKLRLNACIKGCEASERLMSKKHVTDGDIRDEFSIRARKLINYTSYVIKDPLPAAPRFL